ncbi:MAG: hypothetical protein WDZ56_00745 [Candidatus Paceibacterota bacterium]
MIFRILSFISIVILSVFITPLISLPIVLWYALRWYAPEIIVLGLIIDAFFGGTNGLPYYTTTAFLLVILAESAKGSLMIYHL